MKNNFNMVITFLWYAFLSYPIVGAINILYSLFIEKVLNKNKYKDLKLEKEEKVSILVPLKNEEEIIETTMNYLCTKLNYKNYEVIFINDGSTDNSLKILELNAIKYNNVKIINLKQNGGKAHALNTAIALCKSEYILTCDIDTLLEKNGITKYLKYLNMNENIGAVSGNVIIRNRNKIIEKAQIIEFASIVGLLRNAQNTTLNKIFTFSGANTMYRKKALLDVGLFKQNKATEDIAIAWDIQINGWKTMYAEDVYFFNLVPNNVSDLFKQRKRWAIGGIEVWLTNASKIWKNPIKNLGLIIIWIDHFITTIWSLVFFILLTLFIIDMSYLVITSNYYEASNLLSYTIIFVHFQLIAGIIQLFVAVVKERKHKLQKYLLFAPVYLIYYWLINPITIVFGVIPGIKNVIFKKTVQWKSAKRS